LSRKWLLRRTYDLVVSQDVKVREYTSLTFDFAE